MLPSPMPVTGAAPTGYIGVFCGSRTGSDSRYQRAAVELGWALAERNIGLVYGGSAAGLMGTVANAALERGGSVVGVIPTFLMQKERAHRGLTELITVDSLELRKSTLLRLSDAFIALPGGMGTLDELFEVLCQGQLGLHAKPCVLFNVGRFYDHLIAFLDHATTQGLIGVPHRALVSEAIDIPKVFAALHRAVDNRAASTDIRFL